MLLLPVKLAAPLTSSPGAEPRVGMISTELPFATTLPMVAGPDTRLRLAVSVRVTASGEPLLMMPDNADVPLIASRLVPLPKPIAPVMVPAVSASVVASN